MMVDPFLRMQLVHGLPIKGLTFLAFGDFVLKLRFVQRR